jgi:hypothetical protein
MRSPLRSRNRVARSVNAFGESARQCYQVCVNAATGPFYRWPWPIPMPSFRCPWRLPYGTASSPANGTRASGKHAYRDRWHKKTHGTAAPFLGYPEDSYIPISAWPCSQAAQALGCGDRSRGTAHHTAPRNVTEDKSKTLYLHSSQRTTHEARDNDLSMIPAPTSQVWRPPIKSRFHHPQTSGPT